MRLELSYTVQSLIFTEH